jgi:hypothetical protein
MASPSPSLDVEGPTSLVVEDLKRESSSGHNDDNREGRTIGTTQPQLKKAKIDYRAWSVDADIAPSSIVYRLRASFGNPKETLPSWIKTSKKEVIQEMMRSSNWHTEEEMKGNKNDLLHRLQTTKPFCNYEIDSRESIQRVLMVALYSFKFDYTHCFSVKMPLRGSESSGSANRDTHDLYGFGQENKNIRELSGSASDMYSEMDSYYSDIYGPIIPRPSRPNGTVRYIYIFSLVFSSSQQ